MNHPSTDQSVRPGVLVAVVGSIAVTVVLVWALKGKPSPTNVAVEAAAPVRVLASAKPTAMFKRAKRAEATPAAVNTERHPWTAATRLSMPEMGPVTTAPAAATSLAGFQGTGTFDYQVQAAQVAEVVRNAIVQEDQRGDAMLPGSANDFAQSQGAGGFIAQPEWGGIARPPGSATQFAGSPATGPDGSRAQAGPVAASVRNAGTPPEPGGDLTSPGSAAQVSLGSGPPGAQVVNNAVDAYREGERLRRAYVEEMRVRRIVTIAEARQREGI